MSFMNVIPLEALKLIDAFIALDGKDTYEQEYELGNEEIKYIKINENKSMYIKNFRTYHFGTNDSGYSDFNIYFREINDSGISSNSVIFESHDHLMIGYIKNYILGFGLKGDYINNVEVNNFFSGGDLEFPNTYKCVLVSIAKNREYRDNFDVSVVGRNDSNKPTYIVSEIILTYMV